MHALAFLADAWLCVIFFFKKLIQRVLLTFSWFWLHQIALFRVWIFEKFLERVSPFLQTPSPLYLGLLPRLELCPQVLAPSRNYFRPHWLYEECIFLYVFICWWMPLKLYRLLPGPALKYVMHVRRSDWSSTYADAVTACIHVEPHACDDTNVRFQRTHTELGSPADSFLRHIIRRGYWIYKVVKDLASFYL